MKNPCTQILLVINIGQCFGYVGYEMFHGFDVTDSIEITTVSNNITTRSNVYFTKLNYSEDSKDTVSYENITNTPSPKKAKLKLNCPENENPSNIGPYEVPTQRDVVYYIKDTLIRMYQRYHDKALLLLKDIKEATRATNELAKRCPVKQRHSYQECVKRVRRKCDLVTKAFVTTLERQREDVNVFNEATACNIASLKLDPLTLIKVIAMEDATLSFALPGFLRLLNACNTYCLESRIMTTYFKKPLRHMTDQDLVVKHFLTKKTYIQLIKGTK